jgi:twinkle protein
MENYEKYGITIPNGRTTGQVYTTCPECSRDRKKKHVKCLGINLDKKIWNCSHCSFKGFLKEPREKKIYAKPIRTNITALSEKAVKWFSERGITQQTLVKMQIGEGLEWMPQTEKEENAIKFNYFKDGEICNIKYRTGAKHFKLFKDAELVFYNLDCVKNSDSIYIVEGEMDALSILECGIENVISVPNGANKNTNNLQYIENCVDYFENIKEVYLATDNDIAGRNLQEELALRFGKDKCFKIDFKDCKDANEYLLKYGKVELGECLKNKTPFPIEGVFTVSDISDEIDDMYENGLEKGLTIGLENHDKGCSFVKGYVTTITGVPSHGKSEYLDFILMRLNLLHGWKGAFYSPENRPLKLHFSKMAEKLIGKNWDGARRMSVEEKDGAKNYLNEKIWFIKPSTDFTLQTILDSVQSLIRRYGIDYFVIDAWNKLDHKYAESETKYIGESLDAIGAFCETNKVMCFLVAHPTKIKKDKLTGIYEVPTLYDIAGSANFFNKTDVGICVYRNFELKKTTIYFQKIKFKHWGNPDAGFVDWSYNMGNGRYYERDTPDNTNWMDEKPNAKKSFLQQAYDF